MGVYNLAISLWESSISLAGLCSSKARLRAEGRKGLVQKIKAQISPDERVFWVHAASVGEFEQGRPVIEYVRQYHPEYKILVTFYSSSGYELRKNFKGADYIFYFPSDKPKEVRAFLDAIHPEIAVFVKYEFWLNTLMELKKRGVRTFLISSIFRADSIFFKKVGSLWREALTAFETIFVQDEASLKRLASIGVTNVVIAGDTRFDRVREISQAAKVVPLVERFCAGNRVFVAGSTWGSDEKLLIPLINANPDIKFIIAPHEMNEARICRILQECRGGACRYTSPTENIENLQVMVLDTIGVLSSVYRYATWAYIGGGFGVGIHNTVEPATFGLPLAFGPKYKKFNEAVAMVKLGIARPVENYRDLESWFGEMKENENARNAASSAALEYTTSQLGATKLIIKKMGL